MIVIEVQHLKNSQGQIGCPQVDLVDAGRKLNVHKMFSRRPGRLLNVLYTFNLRPKSSEDPG